MFYTDTNSSRSLDVPSSRSLLIGKIVNALNVIPTEDLPCSTWDCITNNFATAAQPGIKLDLDAVVFEQFGHVGANLVLAINTHILYKNRRVLVGRFDKEPTLFRVSGGINNFLGRKDGIVETIYTAELNGFVSVDTGITLTPDCSEAGAIEKVDIFSNGQALPSGNVVYVELDKPDTHKDVLALREVAYFSDMSIKSVVHGLTSTIAIAVEKNKEILFKGEMGQKYPLLVTHLSDAQIVMWEKAFFIPFVHFGNLHYKVRLLAPLDVINNFRFGSDLWLGSVPDKNDTKSVDTRLKGAVFVNMD